MVDGRSAPRLSVTAARPNDLFEEGSFPYVGPMLKEPVRTHLLARARLSPRVPRLELDFRFEAALSAEEKARFEGELRSFYVVAMEEAHLELHVNRLEGGRAFLWGLLGSAIALGIAIPLRLYLGFDFYILEFLAVVVVWILMWDSIEKLLWESMLLRMRYRATQRLRDASIRYTPARPIPLGPSSR